MLKFSQKGLAPVIVLVILLGGLAAGTYLVQQRTNFLPQAKSKKQELKKQENQAKKSRKQIVQDAKRQINQARNDAKAAHTQALKALTSIQKLAKREDKTTIKDAIQLATLSRNSITKAKQSIDKAVENALAAKKETQAFLDAGFNLNQGQQKQAQKNFEKMSQAVNAILISQTEIAEAEIAANEVLVVLNQQLTKYQGLYDKLARILIPVVNAAQPNPGGRPGGDKPPPETTTTGPSSQQPETDPSRPATKAQTRTNNASNAAQNASTSVSVVVDYTDGGDGISGAGNPGSEGDVGNKGGSQGSGTTGPDDNPDGYGGGNDSFDPN